MDLSQPRSETKSFLSSCKVGCNGSNSDNFSDDSSSFSRNDDNLERNQIMKQTEDLLSSELYKLSLQERSKALEDVHCVGKGLEETDEMMNQALEEFDRILIQGNYPIYNQAVEQNREYMEDRKFRLMFLRSKLYDVHEAVNQLVNHLHQKAKYFGEDKLARDITLDDLNSEDLDHLLACILHIQEGTDRFGRPVLYMFSHALGNITCDSLIRAHYYMMFNILLPNPTVQAKGVTGVYYDTLEEGQKLCIPYSLPDMLKVREYRISVPIRYSAMHLCLKTDKQENLSSNSMFLNAMLRTLTQYAKVRTQVHYGSHMEMQYILQSYGIPKETFPVDSDGRLCTGILNAWFFKHLEEEGVRHDFDFFQLSANDADELLLSNMDEETTSDQNASFNNNNHEVLLEPNMGDDAGIPNAAAAAAAVAPPDNNNNNDNNRAPVNAAAAAAVVAPPDNNNNNNNNNNRTPVQPRQQDVLLGRGVRLMKHPGNVRFRQFLEAYQDDYDRAQRNKRRSVTISALRVLKQSGVRFLERDGDGNWVESNVAEAEAKVGQVFRSRRKEMKKKS